MIFGALFGKGKPEPEPRFGVEELSKRLDVPAAELRASKAEYRVFTIQKRSGGVRRILAPVPGLKALQRKILRRLLARMAAHANATGFEPRHSIVTNALPHAGKAVVLRMDVQEFFPSTKAGRVERYFREIGWDAESAGILLRLTTAEGGLPQGAPTSPRLANLVNHGFDARLAALAASRGASYSRYADDLTFSFDEADRSAVGALIRGTKSALEECGYRLHLKKKLSIRRAHQRQVVTGLVVNGGGGRPPGGVRLPRKTRRWLRAVEHRLAKGKPATLSPSQLAGWRAFAAMVARQSCGGAA